MLRSLAPLMFLIVSQTAWPQAFYVSAGAGVENFTIDTQKLKMFGAYYSDMFVDYFAQLEGEFDKVFSYKLAFNNDPFWQQTINGGFGIRMGHFFTNFGLLLSLNNPEDSSVQATGLFSDFGIEGGMKLEFTGTFFVGFSVIIDIVRLREDIRVGTPHRQMFYVYGGIWLPHILITANYYQKDFDEGINDTTSTTANYLRVDGKIEFFAKNVMFRFALTGAYVEQTANLEIGGVWGTPSSDSYILAGADFTLDISRFFTWYIRAEMPISGTDRPAQFTAVSGVKIKMFENNLY